MILKSNDLILRDMTLVSEEIKSFREAHPEANWQTTFRHIRDHFPDMDYETLHTAWHMERIRAMPVVTEISEAFLKSLSESRTNTPSSLITIDSWSS